jgi:hypothetical protein
MNDLREVIEARKAKALQEIADDKKAMIVRISDGEVFGIDEMRDQRKRWEVMRYEICWYFDTLLEEIDRLRHVAESRR